MSVFQRNHLQVLRKWRESSRRKPLIIRGARQVGKTTLVQEFSADFAQYIHLNLEKKADREFFELDDVKRITEALLLANKFDYKLSETLLFIDEIQESDQAIELLRYFYEELPELNVIAAGSLLEFALSDVESFPVGRVSYLYVTPVNFGEFLNATGRESLLHELETPSMDNHLHHLFLRLFNEYALIGGMPEIVSEYIKRGTSVGLSEIYDEITTSYRDDIKKYASNEKEHDILRHLITTAPLFADQRITFHNFGNSGYRSIDVSRGFRRLQQAGICQLVHPTTHTHIPLVPDLNKSPRLQWLDSGLLIHSLGIRSKLRMLDDLNDAWKGALVPHIVIQELLSRNKTTYTLPVFWVRQKTQSQAELDLLLEIKGSVVPVEIKSGAAGSLRSLHQYLDRSESEFAVRLYAGSCSIEQHKTSTGRPYTLLNLPYYLAFWLDEYITWFKEQKNID
jgi:predicted AAA+ superfamily ATPase